MHIKTKFVILIDAVVKRYSVILSGAKNLSVMSIFFFFFACPAFSKNIAVIPFQNITGDKEKNWVGAGFAETLTTKIVKVKAITVIEREQLSKILDEIKFQYSGAVDEKTAVEKGKMYGVDVMVLGAFQVIPATSQGGGIVGEKLRVTARFVDVQTRKVIDTAEANGNISDIFKLQDEIAFNLMDSLKIVLAEKEKEEIKINPTEDLTAYQWFSRGEEVSNLKLYDKAIEYYTKAIKLEPKLAEAYNNRGGAYGEKGLYDEAIEDYTKVIQINSKDAMAYNNRGIAYYKKGLYDEAIEDYTKAIQINPKYAEAYCGRGNTYGMKELYDKAIENYTKAIQHYPKYANAYHNRGLSYYKKGLYDEAIKDFTKTIQINPKYAEAYHNRGCAYGKKGLNDLCISDLKKAADLGSEEAGHNLKKVFDIDY